MKQGFTRLNTVILFLCILLLTPIASFPHSGGLNSSGCHMNHKTGDYHCHGAPQQTASGGSSSGRSMSSGGLEVVTPDPPSRKQSIRIVGVTDGDTVRALIEGQEVKIRLYGIDAPESGQAFGKAAQQAFKSITSGRQITIKPMDQDKYGRTVALVFADGINVNELLVSSGYAWTYPQYCKQAFCSDWQSEQVQAKSTKKGLWLDGNPTAPWEWRKSK